VSDKNSGGETGGESAEKDASLAGTTERESPTRFPSMKADGLP